jgi:hypothetical protein
MEDQVKDFVSFANQAAHDGFIGTLWCDMVGSRLFAQVVEQTFGVTAGGLDLRLVDTSDPGTHHRFTQQDLVRQGRLPGELWHEVANMIVQPLAHQSGRSDGVTI